MMKRVTKCGWRHAPGARGGFGGFRRELESWKLDAEQGGSTFEARWGETNLRAMGGARDEEASIKRLCFSPYVETFNSKVIRFRTWTNKSLRVFEFRDSYVLYVYMWSWTFDVHFARGRIWLCSKMKEYCNTWFITFFYREIFRGYIKT